MANYKDNVSAVTKDTALYYAREFGFKEVGIFNKASPDNLVLEEIHCGRQTFVFIHDDITKVKLVPKLDWLDKLFNKTNVVIIVGSPNLKEIEVTGSLLMVNCKGESLKSEGRSVVTDSRFKKLELNGDNSIGYSIFKGETTVVNSNIIASLFNTQNNTIDDCEVNYSQFNGELVRFKNQCISDTTVNGDRSRLLKKLMVVSNNNVL